MARPNATPGEFPESSRPSTYRAIWAAPSAAFNATFPANPVCDHNVGRRVEESVGFDESDISKPIVGLQEPSRLAHGDRSFAHFRTDVQKAHGGNSDSVAHWHLTGVRRCGSRGRSQQSELVQLFRVGSDIRAEIEHPESSSLRTAQGLHDRGAADVGEHTHQVPRQCHQRTRTTGTHHGVRIARRQSLHRATHRRVDVATKRTPQWIIHFDSAGRMNDLVRRPGEQGSDVVARTEEDQPHRIRLGIPRVGHSGCRIEGPAHESRRRRIATQDVNGYADGLEFQRSVWMYRLAGRNASPSRRLCLSTPAPFPAPVS